LNHQGERVMVQPGPVPLEDDQSGGERNCKKKSSRIRRGATFCWEPQKAQPEAGGKIMVEMGGKKTKVSRLGEYRSAEKSSLKIREGFKKAHKKGGEKKNKLREKGPFSRPDQPVRKRQPQRRPETEGKDEQRC